MNLSFEPEQICSKAFPWITFTFKLNKVRNILKRALKIIIQSKSAAHLDWNYIQLLKSNSSKKQLWFWPEEQLDPRM